MFYATCCKLVGDSGVSATHIGCRRMNNSNRIFRLQLSCAMGCNVARSGFRQRGRGPILKFSQKTIPGVDFVTHSIQQQSFASMCTTQSLGRDVHFGARGALTDPA